MALRLTDRDRASALLMMAKFARGEGNDELAEMLTEAAEQCLNNDESSNVPTDPNGNASA